MFAQKLLDDTGRGLYTPYWNDSRLITKAMKEELKNVLYEDEWRRFENKTAGRAIGLANTWGDVVVVQPGRYKARTRHIR